MGTRALVCSRPTGPRRAHSRLSPPRGRCLFFPCRPARTQGGQSCPFSWKAGLLHGPRFFLPKRWQSSGMWKPHSPRVAGGLDKLQPGHVGEKTVLGASQGEDADLCPQFIRTLRFTHTDQKCRCWKTQDEKYSDTNRTLTRPNSDLEAPFLL